MSDHADFTRWSLAEGVEHTPSGPCDECWDGYPRKCEFACPGMVHAVFGDEMEDGYYLSAMCNVCGTYQ